MRLLFRIFLETPAVFDTFEESGQPFSLSTSLQGRVRSNFQKFLKTNPQEEEIIFGNASQKGKIYFKRIPFEGEPFTKVSIGFTKDSTEKTTLRQQLVVPEDSSLLGEILIDDDITESQLTVIKEALLSLSYTGIGKQLNYGYGKCRVEFIDDVKNVGSVFISYSWEEAEHDKWVLGLANRLTKDGIQVIFDKYDLAVGDNIPVYMEQAIEKANKILVILTPLYKMKFDKREGGVGYETALYLVELSTRLANNSKVLPVLRKGDIETSVPRILRQYFVCDMRNTKPFEKSYSELYSSIIGKKTVERPKSNIG